MKVFKDSKMIFVFFSAAIIFLAFLIGMHNISESGVQWAEDGSRYLNNGAMIRDYLLSGSLLEPYEFAKRNYIQYPGFSVPYHPPGYAFLLGIWFILFGMSYETGRLFIALMLGLIGVYFFKILNFQKVSMPIAFICSILLISSYEMIHWGRSTMSEVPSLAFLMIASYYFLRWSNDRIDILCWLAFFFAGLGFYCRVNSAGILPTWFLYLILQKRWKKLFSIHLIFPSFIYLMNGYFWTKFAGQFAKNEIPKNLAHRLTSYATVENLTVWLKALPDMIGSLTLIFSLVCLIFLVIRKEKEFAAFWSSWFISYYFFQVMLAIHFEARYFFYAIPPVFAFLAGVYFIEKSRLFLTFGFICFFVIFSFNLVYFNKMPKGITGHDRTADILSGLNESGNILLSCWNDADLIFRYRCKNKKIKRQLIRGDRTLAIRVSAYAGVPDNPIVKSFEDFKKVIEDGGIRYILTSSSKKKNEENRPADMILAHSFVTTHPNMFKLLNKNIILFDTPFEQNEAEVFIWQYEGVLKSTQSKLPVFIPTANIEL